MSELIEHLTSFNRKERFFLLRDALGKDKFSLDKGFRSRLKDSLGLSIPPGAYVAMDYHLDWLQMAVYLAMSGDTDTLIPKGKVLAEDQEEFNKNQMDVDLLIAFDEGPKTHIVMVEAKLDTSWTNTQMDAKVARLKQVFPHPWDTDTIHPHFVLVSRSKPVKLGHEDWPDWMKHRDRLAWMPLSAPAGLKITRSNAEGRPSRAFTHLKIRPAPH